MKIIVQEMLSLDGLFSGPKGETDWFITSEDMSVYSLDLLNSVDAILYGANTYRMMAGFWPDPPPEFTAGSDTLKKFVKRTNEIQKLIVTKDAKTPWGEWNNATPLNGDLAEEVKKLKAKDGRGVVIYGSGNVVRQLANLGLIDEYRLIINPLILGEGVPLFEDVHKIELKLTDSKPLSSGAVILEYATKSNG